MKTYPQLFYFFSVLFLLSGCGKAVQDYDAISFDVGFAVTANYSGSYVDNVQNRRLLYFADPVTAKSLKIFNDEAALLHEINLKEPIDRLQTIDDITVFAPDTIVLNSRFTNKIAVIDSKGQVWKFLDLQKTLTRGSNVYEVHSSAMKDLRLNESLLFNSEWRQDVTDIPENSWDIFTQYYERLFVEPYFVKISDFLTEPLKAQFGFRLYPLFMDEASFIIEPPFYTVVNGRLLVTSHFSNEIFEVDAESLELKGRYPIASSHTKIGHDPIPINKNTFANAQQIVDKYAKTAGRISMIEYDPLGRRYVVVVYHETDTPKTLPEQRFSLIFTDENFNIQNEIAYTNSSFAGWFCLRTDKNLLFYANENSDDAPHGNKKFVILPVH